MINLKTNKWKEFKNNMSRVFLWIINDFCLIYVKIALIIMVLLYNEKKVILGSWLKKEMIPMPNSKHIHMSDFDIKN